MSVERPILFTASMVRALLDGSKTQTRRVVKLPHQNPLGKWESFDWGGPNGGRTAQGETVPFQQTIAHTRTGEIICCPYGQPGDRLWVRETWAAPHSEDARPPRAIQCDQMRIHYAASEGRGGLLWRPSIHMPRWTSRVTLEIVSVRVERLQTISRGDAMGEGCPFPNMAQGDDPRQWYADLWEQINGPGTWVANPWVWVIEFKKALP